MFISRFLQPFTILPRHVHVTRGAVKRCTLTSAMLRRNVHSSLKNHDVATVMTELVLKMFLLRLDVQGISMSGLVQEPQSSSVQNQRCGLSSSSVLFSFIMSLCLLPLSISFFSPLFLRVSPTVSAQYCLFLSLLLLRCCIILLPRPFFFGGAAPVSRLLAKHIPVP